MILTVKELYKSYSSGDLSIDVLKGMNLSVEKCEILSIKGSSGSGKSTLLHVLGLLDKVDSGEIYYENELINSISDIDSIRANKIGFLFQFHHLLPEFNILENLTIPQMLINKNDLINKEWANELLGNIGLSSLSNRYPDELSGGEKQRIAFLRSIVNRPLIVFADEPTGNLDQRNTEIILDVINKFKELYHISFIVATHDNLVCEMSDRVLNIKKGKLTNAI